MNHSPTEELSELVKLTRQRLHSSSSQRLFAEPDCYHFFCELARNAPLQQTAPISPSPAPYKTAPSPPPKPAHRKPADRQPKKEPPPKKAEPKKRPPLRQNQTHPIEDSGFLQDVRRKIAQRFPHITLRDTTLELSPEYNEIWFVVNQTSSFIEQILKGLTAKLAPTRLLLQNDPETEKLLTTKKPRLVVLEEGCHFTCNSSLSVAALDSYSATPEKKKELWNRLRTAYQMR